MQCSRRILKQGCGTCFLLAIVSLILLWDTQINVEEWYASNAPVLSSLPQQSANNGNTIESGDFKSFSGKIVKTKLLSEDSSVSENSKSIVTSTNTASSEDLIQKDSTKNKIEGQFLSEEDGESKVEENNLNENDHEADKSKEMETEKEKEGKPSSFQPNKNLPQCPDIPPNLVGRLKVEQNVIDWDQLEKVHNKLLPGGEFTPDCLSEHKVAVIIPFRDRDEHLRIFLHHIHPILMRQNLHYRIFIISQDDSELFNRAMLFNVGYVEAMKIMNFNCLVFHDVDLLPEDDRNIYTCADNPRHLSVSIDKFKYKLPYVEIFGGAAAMTPEQLTKVNGFSNQYWGWGGEDDDMFKRIDANKFKIIRYKPTIARYTMIKHEHEESNKVNPERFNMLKKAPRFQKTDGLNNLNYTILNITSLPLMTRISVKLHHLEMVMEPEPEKKD